VTDSLARKANAITDLARTAASKERDAGFPTLSRIPSSTVKRFLTFYATLGQEDAVRWSNFTLSRIPLMFLEKWQPTSSPEDAAWFKECLDASFAHFWGWDTLGLRELKNAVSLSESAKAGPLDISWIPLDRIDWLRSLQTAKAADLRRILKALFNDKLGLHPENKGGGCWAYSPEHGEDGLVVHLDFGGRGSQLRYDVQVRDCASDACGRRLSFEAILGVTSIGWEWIEEATAQQSCEMLTELVK